MGFLFGGGGVPPHFLGHKWCISLLVPAKMGVSHFYNSDFLRMLSKMIHQTLSWMEGLEYNR